MAGVVPPAGLALDGGDPRTSNVLDDGIERTGPSEHRNTHDPSIMFEEYMYYAKITREQEAQYEKGVETKGHSLKQIFPGKHGSERQEDSSRTEFASTNKETLTPPEKEVTPGQNGKSSPPGYTLGVSDDEWTNASRAGRTATWGAVFYLITTDILGPFSVPWAMSRMGYGPGIVLYTIFGLLAAYGGWMLWRMYLKLDSNQYPLRSYGDIVFRVYGTYSRYAVNILQSIQLLFNVGVIIIANGQSLSQMSKGKVCFSVLCIIWTIIGALLGQVRTLKRFGWIAHAAIWLNLITLFTTMGVVAHSAPNFGAAMSQNGIPAGPIMRTGGSPAGVDFEGQVVGLMQAVYSYGGSMIFVEFMAEMRRPWDFWKGMLSAQLVIYTIYLMFGLFVYSFQGQFTINPANQGISIFSWQTATNALGLVSSLIAAALYGNIGIKVVYQNIFKEMLNGPELTTRKGKILWVAMVPVYWAFAFIIASAIPQISNISGLVAAACILQFTYTFPPLLMLGFEIKQHAMLEGEGYNPVTKQVTRHDSGMRRWTRGMKHQWYLKLFNFIFFLGAAVTAVLGIFSSIKGIIAGFEGQAAATAFGCQSPVIG